MVAAIANRPGLNKVANKQFGSSRGDDDARGNGMCSNFPSGTFKPVALSVSIAGEIPVNLWCFILEYTVH